MPVDIEALSREMDTTGGTPEPKEPGAKVDRGDEMTPEQAAIPDDDDTPRVEKPKVEEKKTEEKKEEPKVEEKKDEPKAEEKSEAPRDPDTGKFIPKARFDEAVQKLRQKNEALEAQLTAQREAAAKSGSVEELETKLDERTDKYQKLLADGKLDEAKVLMREINKINRDIARLEILPEAAAHDTGVARATSLEETIDFYKREFPIFDESAAEFNQDYVNWVAHTQGVYQKAGYSPTAALQEAVDLAISKYGLSPTSAPKAVAAEPKKPAKEDVEAKRVADGVKKAVDTSNKQPPSLSDVGTDSDKAGLQKVVVGELSQDEFAKLPESTLKRLRGDSF